MASLRFTFLVSLVLVSCLLSFGVAEEEDGELFEGTTGDAPPSVAFNPNDDPFIAGRSFAGYEVSAMQDSGLSPRQRRCPYPVMCSATTCCPSGTNCCGTGIKCCPTYSNCHSLGCCPKNAVTCGRGLCATAGSVCCGSTVCRPGYQCNTRGGTVSCCRPDQLKCLGTCCPSGSRCSSQRGYCLLRKTRVFSRLSTRSSTSTSTRTSSRIPSRTSTLTLPTATDECPTGLSKRGSEFRSDLQKRQNLRPNCDYECHGGKLLSVLTIESISGETDQLFISMCSGILATGGGRGGDGNFDILTYQGSDGKIARRRAANCRNFKCSTQKKIFNDPDTLQCDEYPPAMALQGGSGAHRTCIPQSQNSGAQARIFRDWQDRCDPQKGEDFVLHMKGGCRLRNEKRNPVTDIRLRSQELSTDTFSAVGGQLNKFSNLSYVYVPFKDLSTGRYTFDVSIAGTIKELSVLDEDGEVYFRSTERSQEQHVEFEVRGVPSEDAIPAALILDADRSVKVTYSATAHFATAPTKASSAFLKSNNNLLFVLPVALAIFMT